MYDLKEIKAIPCANVAQKYGMDLSKKHNRLWGKLRNEKNSSFSINLDKNLWYDFGAGKGGSVIDLVAEIEGISPTEAINKLAQEYGFEKEKIEGWRPLTDSQYTELGIQPERATMNFKFDLNKHSEEQLERWSNKYGMPVKDLAQKFPTIYNTMILKIGLENINTIRNTYFAKLDLFKNTQQNQTSREFLKTTAKEDAYLINRKAELLQRALTSSNKSYENLKVNIDKDFNEKTIEKKFKKPIPEDEKVKLKMVKVYKKLFNYNKIETFSVEQAKTLQETNKMLTGSPNKFLSIVGIKKIYNHLGQSIEKLEKEHMQLIKQSDKIPKNKEDPLYKKWEVSLDNTRSDLAKAKYLFIQCNSILEGVRESNLMIKKEIEKHQTLSKSTDIEF